MPRRPRFTESQLREAIAASRSFSEALRQVGLRPAGGNHGTIKKYAARWAIDTSHFDPDAGRVGLHQPPIPLAEVLVEGSTYHRRHLKRRLLAEGIKQARCELCGQGEIWRGRPMALILDHINGVPDDNRLENLRIVCPNCSATFETHCGRKNRRDLRRACLRCGVEFVPRDARQRYCSRECGQRWDRAGHPRPGGRKVERPPYEQLVAEVAATSWSAVGRRYGVSDNAVRKWVRQYERERAVVDAGPGDAEELAGPERGALHRLDDLVLGPAEARPAVRQIAATTALGDRAPPGENGSAGSRRS